MSRLVMGGWPALEGIPSLPGGGVVLYSVGSAAAESFDGTWMLCVCVKCVVDGIDHSTWAKECT